jgi:hypothetical protein
LRFKLKERLDSADKPSERLRADPLWVRPPRGQTISLKRYLDAIDSASRTQIESGVNTPIPRGDQKQGEKKLLPVVLAAHRSALLETGKYSQDASFGLAERGPEETLKALIDRADAGMYRQKAASVRWRAL